MDFIEALKKAADGAEFNPNLKHVMCTTSTQPGIFWIPYRDNDSFTCAKCKNLATKKGIDQDEKLLFLSCLDCMFTFQIEK